MTINPQLIAALSPITSRVRQDVTAVRRPDGTSRWTTEPLTPERLAKHLNGGPARGVCPIKAGESTTRLALLDFDSHKGEVSWSEMAVLASRVMDSLDLVHGAPSVAFRSSGGRGVHLYVLWDEAQDAYSVRRWLGSALAMCGLRDGTKGVRAGEVEVFPKQNEVPVGGYGNQAILPLAGKSELLAPCELSGMLVSAGGPEAVLGVQWGCAGPVPVLERPQRVTAGVVGGVLGEGNAPLWRQALDAIPNGRGAGGESGGGGDLGYDEWRNIIFAIHHETEGSAEGLALAMEWSSRSAKFDPEFLENRVWPYIKSGGRGGAELENGARVTGGTILSYAARHCGWQVAPTDDAFDVVPFDTQPVPEPGLEGGGTGVVQVDEGLPLELPVFDRKKSGAILPIFENALKAIERPDVVGWGARCDTFRDEVMVLPPGSTEWRAWRANDVGELRVVLKGCGFESCGKEIVRDALVQAAGRREYDSAQQWLGGLEGRWDGVPRCETFLIDFWGAADTAYTRAVGRYMWTALAGRVITPGCQADMVPIFEGHQGLRKTSGLAALVPDYTLFTEVDLTSKDADLARAMKGVLVCEISELRGLHTRDQESIKAFVTRRYEKWVPKFVEQATSYKRRSVLFGTTNRTDILADETGNRRWLPLHVERVDVEGIEGARDQLWAEAAALYRAGGVDWHGAETLATVEHEAFMWTDSWEEAIAKWLEEDDEEEGVAPSAGRKNQSGTVHVAPFTTAEVLTRALGILQKDANMGQQRRVGAVLRKMGFDKQKKQVAGVRTLYWIKQKP